jgi:hypothetical protein
VTSAAGQRIQVDFETLTGAASSIAAVSPTTLPAAAEVERPTSEAVLVSIRDGWRSDTLVIDLVELGTRLGHAAGDFRTTEEAAARELRALEGGFE